jgi:hypothetical protein
MEALAAAVELGDLQMIAEIREGVAAAEAVESR